MLCLLEVRYQEGDVADMVPCGLCARKAWPLPLRWHLGDEGWFKWSKRCLHRT